MATVRTSCGGLRIHATPGIGPDSTWACACEREDPCRCGRRNLPLVMFRVERALVNFTDKHRIVTWIPLADAIGTEDGRIIDADTLSEGRIVQGRLDALEKFERRELMADIVQGMW